MDKHETTRPDSITPSSITTSSGSDYKQPCTHRKEQLPMDKNETTRPETVIPNTSARTPSTTPGTSSPGPTTPGNNRPSSNVPCSSTPTSISPNNTGLQVMWRRQQRQKSYPFVRNGSIPVGSYDITIDKLEQSRTNSGNDAWDACYTLRGASGNTYRMRSRYPVDDSDDGPREDSLEQRLYDILDAAKVPKDTSAPNIKGYTFNGDLDYNPDGYAEITIR